MGLLVAALKPKHEQVSFSLVRKLKLTELFKMKDSDSQFVFRDVLNYLHLNSKPFSSSYQLFFQVIHLFVICFSNIANNKNKL